MAKVETDDLYELVSGKDNGAYSILEMPLSADRPVEFELKNQLLRTLISLVSVYSPRYRQYSPQKWALEVDQPWEHMKYWLRLEGKPALPDAVRLEINLLIDTLSWDRPLGNNLTQLSAWLENQFEDPQSTPIAGWILSTLDKLKRFQVNRIHQSLIREGQARWEAELGFRHHWLVQKFPELLSGEFIDKTFCRPREERDQAPPSGDDRVHHLTLFFNAGDPNQDSETNVKDFWAAFQSFVRERIPDGDESQMNALEDLMAFNLTAFCEKGDRRTGEPFAVHPMRVGLSALEAYGTFLRRYRHQQKKHNRRHQAFEERIASPEMRLIVLLAGMIHDDDEDLQDFKMKYCPDTTADLSSCGELKLSASFSPDSLPEGFKKLCQSSVTYQDERAEVSIPMSAEGAEFLQALCSVMTEPQEAIQKASQDASDPTMPNQTRLDAFVYHRQSEQDQVLPPDYSQAIRRYFDRMKTHPLIQLARGQNIVEESDMEETLLKYADFVVRVDALSEQFGREMGAVLSTLALLLRVEDRHDNLRTYRHDGTSESRQKMAVKAWESLAFLAVMADSLRTVVGPSPRFKSRSEWENIRLGLQHMLGGSPFKVINMEQGRHAMYHMILTMLTGSRLPDIFANQLEMLRVSGVKGIVIPNSDRRPYRPNPLLRRPRHHSIVSRRGEGPLHKSSSA